METAISAESYQMNLMPLVTSFASGITLSAEGDIRRGYSAFGKGMADFMAKTGADSEEMVEMASTLMEAELRKTEQERKKATFQCTRPYSMVATQKKASEIRDAITVMNNFLMCSEIIFCDLEQKYAYRILDLLEEKGLYRHLLKKHANRLRDLTGMLQMRIRDNDQAATQKISGWVIPSQRYAERMHEESGGIAFKLQMAFLRQFDMKLKLIRMDNREIAKKMNLKHPDLMSEIFTLLALTETAIDLYTFCQKRIQSVGRGRLIDHSIKSTHHESVRNAVKGLVDQFVDRNMVMPEIEAVRARKHVEEFQMELMKDESFEMFNAQYMATRIDYIEFYLGSVRMEIENGTVGKALIREVWKRLGTKQATKSFFKQLAKIPIPTDEDTNVTDVANAISEWDGKVKTVDLFRRMCVEGEFAEAPKESDDEFRGRVLRTVARKFNGQLPDDVLSTLMRTHGTKKAVVEQLEKAGFELAPTLKRVKAMKAAELKKL